MNTTRNTKGFFILLTGMMLSLTACKKDTKTIEKIDPVTGKKTTVEVPVEEAAKPMAIADSAGVYHQKFLLETGKKYPFTTYKKEIQTITDPQGKTMNMTAESTDEMDFEVKSFDKDIYDIIIHLKSKRNSQTGNGKTIVVDTNQPAPKDANLKGIYTMNKALVGNTLNMKMKSDGTILSIKGFEEIQKKLDAAVNSLTKNEQERKMMAQGVKQSFNETVLKEQISSNLKIFPKKGLKVGEKLTKTDEVGGDGKTKISTTYTFEGIRDGQAIIKVSGGLPKKSDSRKQGEYTQTMSAEMSQSGEMKFDAATGWLTTQNIMVTTTQKESISNGKQTQSMSSTSKSSITVNPSANKPSK